MQFHPFHIVDSSPWPILGAGGVFTSVMGLVLMSHSSDYTGLLLGLLVLILVSFQWWRDICREGTFLGDHTVKVVSGLKIGVVLFIVSEVMFFFSFFWAYFHSSFTPSYQIGQSWPSQGVKGFDPMMIPLLNTSILLASGVSITWAHHSSLNSKFKESISGLSLTVILGVYFMVLQGLEYQSASFAWADSVYGSIFFSATGFHGLHVSIGTFFLSISLIRSVLGHFSCFHHIGFEASAWYWHFVDVVWLFLYISIYWWGGF